MLRGKTGKTFWFSSLGQIVQFGAMIFCRTFKNYFGQFVWIEKKSHYNSRVSLHEAPTNKGPRKETFDWFRSYSVRSYSLSPGKSPFSIIISGTIELRHSLDYGNSTGTILLNHSDSWGIIDTKYP